MKTTSSIVSMPQPIVSRWRSDLRTGLQAPGDLLGTAQLAAQLGGRRNLIGPTDSRPQ